MLVAKARSRAMRMKAGLPVPGAEVATGANGVAAVPEADEEEPEAADEVVAEAGDPMAEVPAELLSKPFSELSKEERVLVAKARSRAMRAKAGLPAPGADA